jgi:cell wall-associated NlpC family hydrolase
MIVECARTMLGTRWVHMGRERGGLDCGGLALRPFYELGLLEKSALQTPYYPQQFMMNSEEQRFVGIVEQFCNRVQRPGFATWDPAEPLMPIRPTSQATARDGDLALYRVGKVVAHCAIVDKWPRVIHAHARIRKVDYADSLRDGELASKFVGIWKFKEWT